MSRTVFNPANRKLLCSILYAPHPLPPPAIANPVSLALRLQQHLSTRVSRRYSSAPAAVAPVPEEEYGSAEVDRLVPENNTAEAEALQAGSSPDGTVDSGKASQSKPPSIALLPPEVLERIEKKATQYDEEQAAKALVRKERKLRMKERKERRKMEENASPKREMVEDNAKSTKGVSTIREDEAGEKRTRPAKKNRWPGEVKAAMKAMSDRNKDKIAAVEKEPPGRKQKAAVRSLKEWLHEMQETRDTLIDTRGPPEQIKAIQEAIQECVTSGRIPGYRPTRRRDEGSVTKKDDSFSSPFFSQPTENSPSSTTNKNNFFLPPESSPTPTTNKHFPTSSTPPLPNRSSQPPPDSPSWKFQRHALQTKFAETGWNPRRKLSPDAQRGIRDLHASNPELYSTPVLAETFKISPEAIRRILRSKWMDKVAGATSTEGKGDVLDAAGLGGGTEAGGKMQELRERWAKRYDKIWDQKSELGLLPKRTSKRRAESGEKGRRRVEEGLWRDEVLDVARREEEGLA